jgi:heme exporter protein B
LLVVEIIALPLFYFFFLPGETPASSLPLVIWPLLIGSVGIAGVGTLLATITASAHGKDVLLAILFVPVIYPLLHAVVSATTVAITGSEDLMAIYAPALALAGGYDVIMLSLSWLLYDFVISN